MLILLIWKENGCNEQCLSVKNIPSLEASKGNSQSLEEGFKFFDQVYSKRNEQNIIDHDTDPASLDKPSPKDDVSECDDERHEDIYLPIAIKKEVRLCTQHPIMRYVCYFKLSKDYHCFISSLTSCVIPKSIKETSQSGAWRKAMK